MMLKWRFVVLSLLSGVSYAPSLIRAIPLVFNSMHGLQTQQPWTESWTDCGAPENAQTLSYANVMMAQTRRRWGNRYVNIECDNIPASCDGGKEFFLGSGSAE